MDARGSDSALAASDSDEAAQCVTASDAGADASARASACAPTMTTEERARAALRACGLDALYDVEWTRVLGRGNQASVYSGTRRTRLHTQRGAAADAAADADGDADAADADADADGDACAREHGGDVGGGVGVPVAVKVASVRKGSSAAEALRLEADIMLSLQHPGIVRLYDTCSGDDCFIAVMEMASGGELMDRLIERERYSEADAAQAVRSVLEALAYMHERGVVHRDIKPENLLLATPAEDAPVKIADFGISCVCTGDKSLYEACGTPEYLAPEVLRCTGYGAKADVWSLGVVLYILLSGYPPFWDDDAGELLRKVREASVAYEPADVWDTLSAGARDAVGSMLCADPARRVSAAEALAHPWITGAQASSAPLPADVGTRIRALIARRRLRAVVSVARTVGSLARAFSGRQLLAQSGSGPAAL